MRRASHIHHYGGRGEKSKMTADEIVQEIIVIKKAIGWCGETDWHEIGSDQGVLEP